MPDWELCFAEVDNEEDAGRISPSECRREEGEHVQAKSSRCRNNVVVVKAEEATRAKKASCRSS